VNKISSIKVKPSNQLKLLENQERLVAINERIDEAANFRNEIKKARKHDEIRLQNTKEWMIKNLKKKIDKEEKKEIKKKIDRNNLDEFNLLIMKNKETDILSKQIHLHVNDIIRIQNSLTNYYLDKGEKSEELKREKDRQVNTNKTIAAFKAIKKFIPNQLAIASKHDLALALLQIPTKAITLNTSMDNLGNTRSQRVKQNIMALKYLIKNSKLIRFDINSDFNSRKFCNVAEDHNAKSDNDLKRKIKKLLNQRKHKDEIMIQPTAYYDDNLNTKFNAKQYRDILPILNQTIKHS
jgi:hypothetical protein